MDEPNSTKNIYDRKRNHISNSIASLIIFSLFFPHAAIAHDRATVLFQPPPEEEQPKETEGAASRQQGECTTNSFFSQSAVEARPHLTAIVPQHNRGLTTARHPNFWIYLPENSAKQAILSIKEKGKNPHWQQSANLPKKQGITGIKLSQEAPALEIGKQYQWAVILVCGDRPSPNDPVATSWIERVEASEIDNLNSTSTTLEKASAYAKQGIWYDALNLLIAQQSSLDNWKNIWSEYLESGGLSNLSQEPIVGNLLPLE